MIKPSQIIRETFLKNRDELFATHSKQTDSLEFSMKYSMLTEEYIRALTGTQKFSFVLTSAGSFSRRELSPYSDIDLIFITKSIEQNERKIAELVQLFWDNDLEVSHTVRDFSDIEKFLKTDLHAFTQLFETRLLLGSEIVYSTWNKNLIGTITDDVKTSLLNDIDTTDVDDNLKPILKKIVVVGSFLPPNHFLSIQFRVLLKVFLVLLLCIFL